MFRLFPMAFLCFKMQFIYKQTKFLKSATKFKEKKEEENILVFGTLLSFLNTTCLAFTLKLVEVSFFSIWKYSQIHNNIRPIQIH